MPSQPAPVAPGCGTNSADAVAAAIAQAKKEKRAAAAAAAMAPRMQSQVQKWAKMTAELGGGHADRSARNGSGSDGDLGDDGADPASARPKKRTKIARSKAKTKSTPLDKDVLVPYAKQLRAPHRRDRYVSFGVGRGLGKAADKTSTDTSTQAVPPTCLLCLARFASRQQLRDHESLSVQHKQRLRDGAARKAAFQRFARVEARTDAKAEAEAETEADTKTEADAVRPPVHIKRIPRRRGDLAPTYTSYAAVEVVEKPEKTENTERPEEEADQHACLLCRRRFRSLATLRLHERESALHRARTRVPELVAAAVKAATAASASTNTRPLLKMRPSQAKGTNQYRDRARERRQAFGHQPGADRSDKDRADKDRADKDRADKDRADKADVTATGLGAALLSKMGWSAGQGLGAQGGGLKEAIAPAAYRVGVGLGAQGGHMGDAAEVAARRTEADGGARAGSSYADFVEQAQEAARQRYKELDRAEAEAAAAAAEAAAAAAAAAVGDTAGEKMEED